MGIQLTNGQTLKSIKRREYLGALDSDGVLTKGMKDIKTKIEEYITRVRKLMKSELDGVNLLDAVNTWVVSNSEVFVE